MAIIPRTDSKGRKRYQVRVNGHKAKTFDTQREAQRYQAELMLSKRRRGEVTCATLVDRYATLWEDGKLPRQKGQKPKRSTVTDRKQHWTLFKDEFGTRPLDELDPLSIETWATKHKWAVRSISPVFNYAVGLELIDHNRFAKYAPQPGEGRKHLEPLADAEVWDLADCAESIWPGGKAFVIWQAFTGNRPSETYVLDHPLKIEDDVVHLEHGIYEGVIGTPKTGPREVFLLPHAKEALSWVPGIAGPVFQTVWGKRFSNQTMSNTYWKKTREEFGRDVAIYELRHYCAHLLYVRMNRPAAEVAAQLGNSPALIENLYGHWRSGAASRLRDHVRQQGVPVERHTSVAHGESKTAHLQGRSA